jgi:large subunit ribosomal protein L5
MQVPRLNKIVLNLGCLELQLRQKVIEVAYEEMVNDAGQKGSLTKSKKDISNLREKENAYRVRGHA